MVEGEGEGEEEDEEEDEDEDAAEVVAELLDAEADRAGKCVSSLALKGGPEEEEEDEVEEEEEEEEVSDGFPSSRSTARTSCQKGHLCGVLLSSSIIPSRQEPSNQWMHVIVSRAWLKAQSDRAQNPDTK
eukprot:evm.model.NODE_10718_length_12398_cov_39.478546.1